MKKAKDLKVGDVIYERGTPLVKAVTITKDPEPEADYDGQDGFLINHSHWLPDETHSQSMTLFTTFEEAREATIHLFKDCFNAAENQTEPETDLLPF